MLVHRASGVALALALFVVGAIGFAGGCGSDSDTPECDETETCSGVAMQSCTYDGCGEISCLAIGLEGHVECNEDGTRSCSLWPETVPQCEDAGTLEQQANCTAGVNTALGAGIAHDPEACAEAGKVLASCTEANPASGCGGALDAMDQSCFQEPLDCG